MAIVTQDTLQGSTRGIEKFTDIFSDPNFHIPVEANFIVSVQNLTSIIDNLNNINSQVIDNTIDVQNTKQYWSKVNGDELFLANGITVPGEAVKSGRAGYTELSTLAGGFLSSPVLQGRSSLRDIEIYFLETNKSFVDYVVRPWLIASSHFGLFARSSTTAAQKQNFKTDISAFFLDRTEADNFPKVRKEIILHNAVPVSVEPHTFRYGNNTDTGVRSIRTTWTYSNYTVK